MVTVIHTLLVDKLIVISAVDVVKVFLIVPTIAKFIRTVKASCRKVETWLVTQLMTDFKGVVGKILEAVAKFRGHF